MSPDSADDGRVLHRVALCDAWTNAQGELAAPFYTAIFDLGIDALKLAVGIDEAYRVSTRRSTVALEAHVVILAQVPRDSVVVVASRIADCDAKRLHVAQEMTLGQTLVATRECLTISFDLAARRTCAFADDIRDRITALQAAQRRLPAHLGSAHLLGVDRAAGR